MPSVIHCKHVYAHPSGLASRRINVYNETIIEDDQARVVSVNGSSRKAAAR